MLGSIAARLLSLADLAEDVAGRSFLVRWLVLWYVWRADAILREFVAGSEWNTAGRLWSPALPEVRYGTRSADAMALAVSLRALARIVLDMAEQRRRLTFFHMSQTCAGSGHEGIAPCSNRQARREILKRAQSFVLDRVEPIDTS
ncbi:MAG: hypothetical protein ABIK36_03500 [Pseudomonadota bacterium]